MPESEATETGSTIATNEATTPPGSPGPAREAGHVARVDRELARLSSIESVLDRALGHALREMRQGRRYRRLGFELWRDYVREQVGVSLRAVQELMRLDRGCELVPQVGEGIERGALTTWKALMVLRVLGPGSEEAERWEWIERGGRLSARALELEVKAWRAKREEAKEAKEAKDAKDAKDGGTPRATCARPVIDADPEGNEDGEGDWVTIHAPRRAVELWRVGVDVARRDLGWPAPAYRCLEAMVADRFSGVGWEPYGEALEAEVIPVGRTVRGARTRASPTVPEAAGEDEVAAGETTCAPGPVADPCETVSRSWEFLCSERVRWRLGVELDPLRARDAWELDAIVRRIEGLWRGMRRLEGDLLASLSKVEGWRELGATSFDAYCRERLGVSGAEGRRWIRFVEGLRRFPELDVEHGAGRLSYAQVLMLLRVIQPETVLIWVRWAVTRTCKVLRRVVEDAELYQRPRVDAETLRQWEAAARGGRQAPMRPARATCARRRRKPLRWAMPWPEGEPVEADLSTMPPGVALPPTTPHGRPHIVGFDFEATGAPAPEALVGRIRFWCPGDMLVFVRAGLATYDGPDQVPLADHERLERLVTDFMSGYLEDPQVQRVIETYPALERDGWECQVPICSGVGQVHPHHVWHRGHQGPDEPWNISALCPAHHLDHVHGMGTIRVSGRAPDDLQWEIGRRPQGGPPLLRFHNDMRLDLAPPAGPRASPCRPPVEPDATWPPAAPAAA